MGTTDKTAAIRQKRLRERRAKELAEYHALQAKIDELTENLQLSDAERWQLLTEKNQKSKPKTKTMALPQCAHR